jgi:hypothetical protein
VVPQGWIHEFFDLVIFGRSYPEIHHRKDAAWEKLGKYHRAVNHEWYNLFGDEWDFEDLYTSKLKSFFEALQKKLGEKAEEHQVWVAHDVLDKVWDGFPLEERKKWASVFKSMLLNPLLLKRWAGVDVLHGKIKRTSDEHGGAGNPVEYWEDDPYVKTAYRRLKRYVESRSIDQLLYLRPWYASQPWTELFP